MKILIADDTPRRYQSLFDELANLGINRDQVVLVGAANDARDRLDSDQYDLFILDILLPQRVEEEAKTQNALDLVVEVAEGAFKHSPMQMVGITADATAAESVASIFDEHLWALIRYREDSDGWVRQIVNCVAYLQSRVGEGTQPSFGVDLAVMCALPSPELDAVLDLQWQWKPPRPLDDTTFVYDGAVTTHNGTLSVIASAPPRMGMVHSALLASKLIDIARPRILIMAGICAGVPGKTAIGDVLLFDPSWDWQSGKRARDHGEARFLPSPHHLPAPASVRALVQQLSKDSAAIGDIALKWSGPRPGTPKVAYGPVASGSAVLADGDVVLEVKDQHRDLLGIEMEAYGVYAAAHWSGRPQPLAFALKSVCDFADEGKSDDYQAYAAYMSASVVDILIRRYGRRLLGDA